MDDKTVTKSNLYRKCHGNVIVLNSVLIVYIELFMRNAGRVIGKPASMRASRELSDVIDLRLRWLSDARRNRDG